MEFELDPAITTEIDGLTQVQMAVHIRFSPPGHKFFVPPHYEYFMGRFHALGGMSSNISKHIGWAPSRYQAVG